MTEQSTLCGSGKSPAGVAPSSVDPETNRIRAAHGLLRREIRRYRAAAGAAARSSNNSGGDNIAIGCRRIRTARSSVGDDPQYGA